LSPSRRISLTYRRRLSASITTGRYSDDDEA
jgi:hypothetical protein